MTDLLPNLQIRVIQPEARIEAGLYDESRREIVFLDDTRVGDVIEYSYSTWESDTVTDGLFAECYWLGHEEPVLRVHLAVSWAPERRVQSRSVGAVVEVTDSGIHYQAENVQPYPRSPLSPSWFEPRPHVELSEFKDWAHVVAWGLPHYAQPAQPDPQMTAQIKDLRGAGNDLEQATRAVRFVQDEIRYLGIEAGDQAFLPHPAARVLAQRYGDCKGKVNLLVAILTQLGIDAAPALVSTRWQRGVSEQLPAHFAFDHVITHVRLRGRELWIDSTQSSQRGSLLALTHAPHGRALVLRPGERALRELQVKMQAEPHVVVRERIALTAAAETHLDVETTYSGARADDMRAWHARLGSGEVQKVRLDFYGNAFGELAVRMPLTVEDDPLHNRMVVREQYTLVEAGENSSLTVSAWSLFDCLPLPGASREPHPIALAHPVDVRHEVRVDGIAHQRGSSAWFDGLKVESDAFDYSYEAQMPLPARLEASWSFTSKRDHVTAEALHHYLRDARRTRKSLHVSFDMGPFPSAPTSPEDLLWCAYVAGFVIALKGISHVRSRFVARRRQSLRPTSRADSDSGEAPASAIVVRGKTQLQQALSRAECCHAPLFPADGALEPRRVRYGGGELVVYSHDCARCRRSRSRYFSVQD